MSNDLISLAEAAHRLAGVSIDTIRRRIADGTLASVKFGGRRLIPTSEVARIVLLVDNRYNTGVNDTRRSAQPAPCAQEDMPYGTEAGSNAPR